MPPDSASVSIIQWLLAEADISPSILLAITLPLVVSIILFWRTRVSGKLNWWVETSEPFLRDSIILHEKSDLSLMYRGEAVNDPQLVRVELQNSRIKAIAPTDFDGPLKILFEDDAQVLGASFEIDNGPEPGISYKENWVEINPVLLNRGDLISLDIIILNPGKNPILKGKIIDVRIINGIPLADRWDSVASGIVGAVIGAIAMVIMISLIGEGTISPIIFLLVSGFLLAMGAIKINEFFLDRRH